MILKLYFYLYFYGCSEKFELVRNYRWFGTDPGLPVHFVGGTQDAGDVILEVQKFSDDSFYLSLLALTLTDLVERHPTP